MSNADSAGPAAVRHHAPLAHRYTWFHDLLGLYSRRLLADDPDAEAAQTRLHAWYAETVTAAIDWANPHLVRLASHPEAERWMRRALALTDDEQDGHVRAIALNGPPRTRRLTCCLLEAQARAGQRIP